MSLSTLAWADGWPLPSWLAATPVNTGAWLVQVTRVDGSQHTGVLNSAVVLDSTLTLGWAEQQQPENMPWAQLRSVNLLARLQPRTGPAEAGAPATWDAQVPHQLMPFHLRLTADNGLGDIKGQTLGYLGASYGLFLYVEQADGSFRAEWLSSLALAFAQVGSRIWHTGHGRATDQAAAPEHGAPGEPHELVPLAAPVARAQAAVGTALPLASNVAELLVHMEYIRTHVLPPVESIIADLGYVAAPVLAARMARPGSLNFLMGDLLEEELITLEQSYRILSRVAGVPEVDLGAFHIQQDAPALSLGDARRYRVCPLGATDTTFFIASSNPTRRELVLLLSSLLNRHVQLVWASPRAIDEKLEAMVQAARRAGGVAAAPPPPPAQQFPEAGTTAPAAGGGGAYEEDLDLLMTRAIAEANIDPMGENPTDVVDSSNFVLLVRRIIDDARRLDASDIHIETNPGQMLTQIRFRRDGDLEPYLSLPASLRAPLISRIKVMARLDISERRRPQDGKINFAEFGGAALELRVAVLPTHDGLEDVVMRLLASSKPIDLVKLGLQPRDEAKVMKMAQRSFGLILAAGPTGSGKTTTLHSMLKELNTPMRKIWTAEDPIEITQAGLRQVQMNPKIGLTFESAMRAFLRADPDIIMIGEIRDEETAKITIEASLTGHLVLSTLHTNSASESVIRLLDLGMDPLVYADTLAGIVAQRLVRALCPRCAAAKALSSEAVNNLVHEYIVNTPLDAVEGRRRLLEAAGACGMPGAVTVRTAVGCAFCGGKGYKGRMGIYEVLVNSPAIHALIQRRARPSEVFEVAVREGMRSLRHDALEKLVQGRIDLLQARVAYG